ncbi:helix-turn-helix transcriptional regulator, partial [Nostoc sp. NIES-2111]
FDNLVRRNPGLRPLSSETRSRAPRFAVNHVDLGGVSLAAGRCSPYAVELPPGPVVRIQLPLEGVIRVRTNRAERTASAADLAVVMPRHANTAEFPEGIASLVVAATAAEVEALVVALDCSTPLATLQDAAATGGVPEPVRAALVRDVRSACRLLDEEAGILTALDAFQASLRNLLLVRIAHLLASQAPDAKGEVRPDEPALRRCLAYLEGMAGQEVSLIAMARSAGISVRTAQVLFRRHLDTTPTAYLRRLRLDKARLMLERPGPETTVTGVAHASGFTHLSDFAAFYQARFGETPSATLRASRRG